jgi:hypothetical protein
VDTAEQAIIGGSVNAMRRLTRMVYADPVHSGGIKLVMATRNRTSVLGAVSVDGDGLSDTAQHLASVVLAESVPSDLISLVVTTRDRTYVSVAELPSTDNLPGTVLVVAHMNSAEAMPVATPSSTRSHQGMYLDIATIISNAPVDVTGLGLLSDIPEAPLEHATGCYAFMQVAKGMAILDFGMARRRSPLAVCCPIFA